MSETTWLITGASSGLGYALAEHVLQNGERVVMGARTVGPMNELASRYPDRGLAVELDVTKPDQRASAVQRCEDHFGSVDVLVNNAAVDFLGAVEEQDEAAYRATLEVNFFAPVELVRLVLPAMRGRKQGIIVNVSSMDGIASAPVFGASALPTGYPRSPARQRLSVAGDETASARHPDHSGAALVVVNVGSTTTDEESRHPGH